MDKERIADLWCIIIFILKIYIPFFYTAGSAVSAPRIDLETAVKFQECKLLNLNLFTEIETKFKNHLWYFNAENICFSLFDEKVSLETKNLMRLNILNVECTEPRSFRIEIDHINNINLTQFCNQSSQNFFKILDLDCSFLNHDSSKWEGLITYKNARQVAKSIIATNDTAERGVKIAEEYNRVITKNPIQYNNICINAYETRKRYRKKK